MTVVETPWFDAYRKAFLGLVPASDHEFFNHPVACVSVVSTVSIKRLNLNRQLTANYSKIQTRSILLKPLLMLVNPLKNSLTKDWMPTSTGIS